MEKQKNPMKKILVLAAAFLLTNNLFGQVIALQQKKADSDIKIVNGDYQLYFKKTDILDAINYIDKTLNTDHSALIDKVKANKIKVADLKVSPAENSDFVELLKNNLGLYLLVKGKAAIYEGKKQILKLAQDQAPDVVELDGTRTTTVFFSEENSDKEIFLGSINAKLL
jgi:hypothetical protein